jgi:branched-chain amino acid aminotransferase
MPSSTVWVGGQRVDDASISPLDHGYLVGDGVFETLKTIDGTPFALTRHLARLRRSAAGLDLLVPDDATIRAAIDVVLADPTVTPGRLRITVSSGTGPLGSGRGDQPATLVVAHTPAAPWPPAARLATVPWPRNERGATAGLKTTSYAENVVALRAAHDADADEALFVDTRSRLCEGTGSNLFYFVNGHLVTPSLATGCLAGVTRELVTELVEVMVADAPAGLLGGAEEAFITSSTRDVLPVSHLDGHPLPSCPGPRTIEAMEALARLQATTLEP